ncbi:PIN domain-containing protein [Parablastomonas sp. CN1-191]|uniref:PIN domain-containing protein n=1 Tax=Parablastomonas sp. CN1-191 TaxID=3400908 RepID=UPI003BF90667
MAIAYGLTSHCPSDSSANRRPVRIRLTAPTNVLINILDKPGTPAAANATEALGGRVAAVSPVAAMEYTQGNAAAGISPEAAQARLDGMVASGAAKLILPGSLIEVGKLMAVDGLKFNDAQIVAAGVEAGLTTLTSDLKTLANKVPELTETYRPR